MKTKLQTLSLTLSLIFLFSCSGTQLNKTQTGAIVGTVVGSGLGAIIGHATGKTGGGVAIGAATGALLGGTLGNSQDKIDTRTSTQEEQIRRQEEELRRQSREIEELKRNQGDKQVNRDSFKSGKSKIDSNQVNEAKTNNNDDYDKY